MSPWLRLCACASAGFARSGTPSLPDLPFRVTSVACALSILMSLPFVAPQRCGLLAAALALAAVQAVQVAQTTLHRLRLVTLRTPRLPAAQRLQRWRRCHDGVCGTVPRSERASLVFGRCVQKLFAASLSATFLKQHAKVIKPEVLWNPPTGRTHFKA